MTFLLYANFDKNKIGDQLGAADYSYFFLLRAFGAVLAELGEVIELTDVSSVDPLYRHCKTKGDSCVLLSFAPPHKTPLGLACPTVPVFAWEYPNIPEQIEEESWIDDPRHDWRVPLGIARQAICLSNHTAEAVRRSMGYHYPIAAIPSPLPQVSTALAADGDPLRGGGVTLRINAVVLDSQRIGLDPDGLVHPDTLDETPFDPTDLQLLPEPMQTVKPYAAPTPAIQHKHIPEGASAEEYLPPAPSGWELPPRFNVRIELRGVIYTSVLTPSAGRKNWEDLVTAFCWTFRDNEEATLLLKLTGKELPHNHLQLLMMLTKLAPFKCRVIAIYGYLSDQDYTALAEASTYYVNTSLCEGLCLPLVEFLNRGIPAIAPDNTAMADYIRDDIAFVLKSYPGMPTNWPHGDHQINRTSYCQLDWESLVNAFKESYAMVNNDPARYRRMASRAQESIQAYCGYNAVKRSLRRFFKLALPALDVGTDTPVFQLN
ncbi:glycosyltransferase family 1 protein [Dyella sp. M7H15-1]|uniref:glycosyltransferase n=1 Tax=Dyella sp. M7H15-1 TaxID=2501295 RepID=UPI0010050621|nr:glycosyltransferase [Dyella sp. M7H15-1]QAU24986.1 glycosyltransferase family 1 protein [Dyella sp. M7H15-1]